MSSIWLVPVSAQKAPPVVCVIVWSVKCKISITWRSFVSRPNPDGFFSPWFKCPRPRVCLLLNLFQGGVARQCEKKKKNGLLASVGAQWKVSHERRWRPPLISTVNDITRPSGLRDPHRGRRERTRPPSPLFAPMWENLQCFGYYGVNLLFGYTTAVPFLCNCRLYWDAANQVKNGDQTARGAIKAIVRNSRCFLANGGKHRITVRDWPRAAKGSHFNPITMY